MNHKPRGLLAIIILIITTVVISACTQSLSQPLTSAATLIPTGLFVSPFPSVENPMAMIEEFAKATASAQTAAASNGTPGTPQSIVTGTILTPQTGGTGTPSPTPGTPTNAIATTPVFVVTTVTPGGPTATSIPPGSRPSTYTLMKNEFPYCIARRFNVDPEDLLLLNGLSSGDVYMAGTTLKIPQTGVFPGDRSLRNHPDTYTVTGSSDDTVYGVACKYGDVDPAAIASANGISVSAPLTIGQQIRIP
jgi:LysM repeat protein